MVIAGDTDLAGDIQGHQCVRNSVAHTLGPFPAAGVALKGDEPERTTQKHTAKSKN